MVPSNNHTFELARREAELRNEILNGGRERYSASTRPVEKMTTPDLANHPQYEPDVYTESYGGDEPVAPESVSLLGIDLVSEQVTTTFGTYKLTDMEAAAMARIALMALQRNFESVLSSLANKHNVIKLEQQAAAELAARQAQPTHDPEASIPNPPLALVPAGHDIDTELPDEDPPPPNPVPLRRGRKPAN